MQAKQTSILNTVLAIIVSTALLIGATGGCASAQAEQAGKTSPSIEETKAIAEEGFIYGLPIVMNYVVMYQFAVDTKSSQFKAPFNQINNQHRVATYKDTAIVTPNSDTPYSLLWLDLRAEPMVISVPAVEKKRYYAVQFIDGNTYNYGYIGSRATGSEPGDYLVVGPDWKGETPAGIKKVFTSTTPSGSPCIGPSSSIPKTCRTWKRCRRDTRRSLCLPSSSNLRRRARRRSIFCLPPLLVPRQTSSSILTLPSSSSLPRHRTMKTSPHAH